MLDIVDKRLRAEQFRTRLDRAMQSKRISQSALARQIGADRSTISQLLIGRRRAPAQCACRRRLCGCTWRVGGLAARPVGPARKRGRSAVASLSLTEAPRALVDEQIFDWHREAAGYKIRHVPAALPDMLKTQAMLEWEYAPHLGRTTDQAIDASQDRLDWMQGGPVRL